VNATLLRLLTLAGASTLLLLCGCGVDDSSTTSQSSGSTENAGGAAGSPSTATSTSTGDCANVQPRTDDFHQTVALTTTTKDGLKYGDIAAGSGAEAVAGKNVTMQYTGWTADGKQFDTSRQSGRGPFEVDNLGQGQVIAGWNEGIQGMKLGGVRRLVIPPALAYGDQAPPGSGIPANATLTFDVQLVCILN
jgi:FKBP-type peptidyl-prolyl cis-trans isomerase FkpA